jgi:hypothetical protein
LLFEKPIEKFLSETFVLLREQVYSINIENSVLKIKFKPEKVRPKMTQERNEK